MSQPGRSRSSATSGRVTAPVRSGNHPPPRPRNPGGNQSTTPPPTPQQSLQLANTIRRNFREDLMYLTPHPVINPITGWCRPDFVVPPPLQWDGPLLIGPTTSWSFFYHGEGEWTIKVHAGVILPCPINVTGYGPAPIPQSEPKKQKQVPSQPPPTGSTPGSSHKPDKSHDPPPKVVIAYDDLPPESIYHRNLHFPLIPLSIISTRPKQLELCGQIFWTYMNGGSERPGLPKRSNDPRIQALARDHVDRFKTCYYSGWHRDGDTYANAYYYEDQVRHEAAFLSLMSFVLISSPPDLWLH